MSYLTNLQFKAVQMILESRRDANFASVWVVRLHHQKRSGQRGRLARADYGLHEAQFIIHTQINRLLESNYISSQ